MTVLAVGDSITNRCSVDLIVDGVAPYSWAQYVAQSAGEELTVYAKPGAPASMVKDLIPELTEHYSIALVFIGVNNVLSWRHWRRENFEDELRAILTNVSAHARRVAVMQIPDSLGDEAAPFAYGPFLGRRRRQAQSVSSAVAADFDAVLIPSPTLSGQQLWIDGVHPTSTGHLAMGQAATTALGLPDPVPASATPRSDYTPWRRTNLVKHWLKAPPRGIGAWLLVH